LKLERIVAATPFYESEHRVHVDQQRLQTAEAHHMELVSECEDLDQIMDVAKNRLEIISKTKRETHLPEMPHNAHTDACLRLKHDADCAASAHLQLDSAKVVCERLTNELRLAESEHNQLIQNLQCLSPCKYESIRVCRPYFTAKLKHEVKIQKEMITINALRTELQEILDRTGAVAPDVRLSLTDFEVPSLDANSAPMDESVLD